MLPEWFWPLVKPTGPSEFWALGQAAVNLGVVAVALKGLHSLSIAKRDLLTRAQRESRMCAVLRCEEMAQVLIKQNGEILAKHANLQRTPFLQSPTDVRFGDEDAALLERAKAWHVGIPFEVNRETVNLLNRMEAWAMYFNTGLADHKIAFGPCGPVFCGLVVRHYATLLVARHGNSSGKYPNIVAVFNDWRAQIDEKVLKEDLNRVQARRTQLPNPIGLGD